MHPDKTAEAGIEAVYRRYFPAIREKCRRMLGGSQEAEDLAQETFARLWAARLIDRPTAQVVAWIYRTSTRLAVDRLRARRSAAPLEAAPEAPGPSLESQISTRQVLAMIARRVPRAELELAVLSRLDGLDQRECAELTGVSERTVRRLMARFETRLARLEKEMER